MSKLQAEIQGPRLIKFFGTFDCDESSVVDDREVVHTLFPEAYSEIYGTILAPTRTA